MSDFTTRIPPPRSERIAQPPHRDAQGETLDCYAADGARTQDRDAQSFGEGVQKRDTQKRRRNGRYGGQSETPVRVQYCPPCGNARAHRQPPQQHEKQSRGKVKLGLCKARSRKPEEPAPTEREPRSPYQRHSQRGRKGNARQPACAVDPLRGLSAHQHGNEARRQAARYQIRHEGRQQQSYQKGVERIAGSEESCDNYSFGRSSQLRDGKENPDREGIGEQARGSGGGLRGLARRLNQRYRARGQHSTL